MGKAENIQTEAVQFCFDNGINLSPHQAEEIARYFYNLGYYDGYKSGEYDEQHPFDK